MKNVIVNISFSDTGFYSEKQADDWTILPYDYKKVASESHLMVNSNKKYVDSPLSSREQKTNFYFFSGLTGVKTNFDRHSLLWSLSSPRSKRNKAICKTIRKTISKLSGSLTNF